MDVKTIDLTGDASPTQQQAVLALSQAMYSNALDISRHWGAGVTANALFTAYVNMALRCVGTEMLVESLRRSADVLEAEEATKQ